MANTKIVALSGQQLAESLVSLDDVTGQITLPVTIPVSPGHVASKEYVDLQAGELVTPAQLATAVAPLAPQSEIVRLDSEIAEKASATSLVALDQDVLHLDGGVLTGPVSQTMPPTQPEHLVTQQYVDDAIAAAIAPAVALSNSIIQGGFTPAAGAEYPASGAAGHAWTITGLAAPYTFAAGGAAGATATNGDQLQWGAASGDWFLVTL